MIRVTALSTFPVQHPNGCIVQGFFFQRCACHCTQLCHRFLARWCTLFRHRFMLNTASIVDINLCSSLYTVLLWRAHDRAQFSHCIVYVTDADFEHIQHIRKEHKRNWNLYTRKPAFYRIYNRVQNAKTVLINMPLFPLSGYVQPLYKDSCTT